MRGRLGFISPQSVACALLLYLGAFAYYYVSTNDVGPGRMPPRAPLRELPLTLGQWQGTDKPLSQDTLDIAAADDHINREYRAGMNQTVNVYIAYYAAPHAETPHLPTICYPIAGWKQLHSTLVEIPSDDGNFQATHILFSKLGDELAVQHWYVDTGVPVSSLTRDKWSMQYVKDMLFKQPRYVVQVQIASTVWMSKEEAYANCEQVARELWPHLKKHLPVIEMEEEENR